MSGHIAHPKDTVISPDIANAAIAEGKAVIIADYSLARRQRLHYGWDPVTNDWWASRSLLEITRLLRSFGQTHALLVGSDEEDEDRVLGELALTRNP